MVPDPDFCGSEPGMDIDGDGFPFGEGVGMDCNDCTAQLNPGAFDAPGNEIDEDCDGIDAPEVESCDGALPMDASAEDAARSIGLCRDADDGGWGLISARWVRADGTGMPGSPLQHGVFERYGANFPREGAALVGISSGVARAPGVEGFTTGCDRFGPDGEGDAEPFPPGFPTSSSSCPGIPSGSVYDSAALEVRLRAPTNARGLAFSTSFFTFEYPGYICSEFNDFFAVLRERDGEWENILFDSEGNPVSVNNGLLRACEPGDAGGKRFECELGRDPLVGTGFSDATICGLGALLDVELTSGQNTGASTGWVRTVTAVEPGEELTLRFAIWDSGDGTLDSLALVDAFLWNLEPVSATSTVPDFI